MPNLTHTNLMVTIAMSTAPMYHTEIKYPVKTTYKEAEFNIIWLKAISSFHSLCLVDEVLAKAIKGKTNSSRDTYLGYMRDAWSNKSLRTHKELKIFKSLESQVTNMGKNQFIHALSRAVLGAL